MRNPRYKPTNLSKSNPEGWMLFERIFATRTRIEQHIVEFSKNLFDTELPATLDELQAKIQAEIDSYKTAHKNAGTLILEKVKAGETISNPPKYHYEIVIKTVTRGCATLTIHEPFSHADKRLAKEVNNNQQ